MLLQCAHCHEDFSPSKIEHTRGKGLGVNVQCPHCHAWLSRNVKLSLGKILGFYTAMGAGIAALAMENVGNFTTPLIILGLIGVGVCHMMDHMVLIEAPEETKSVVDAEQAEVES